MREEGDNFVYEIAVAAAPCTIATHNIRDFVGGELKLAGIYVRTPAEQKTHWPSWTRFLRRSRRWTTECRFRLFASVENPMSAHEGMRPACSLIPVQTTYHGDATEPA